MYRYVHDTTHTISILGRESPGKVIDILNSARIKSTEHGLEITQVERINKFHTIEHHLEQRGVPVITYRDWTVLDQAEIERGKAQGRSRVKFIDRSSFLKALGRESATPKT